MGGLFGANLGPGYANVGNARSLESSGYSTRDIWMSMIGGTKLPPLAPIQPLMSSEIVDSGAASKAAADVTRAKVFAAGRSSTLLTGGAGVTDTATVQRKTLLGE